MPKTAKMFRLPDDLVARMEARCEELGQTQTVFAERALEAALGSGSSVAERAAGLETDPVSAGGKANPPGAQPAPPRASESRADAFRRVTQR